MGAPSPCPVMPPRVKVVCRVSRYALEDMVVVQVCCKLRRTILVVRVAEAGGGKGQDKGGGGGGAGRRRARPRPRKRRRAPRTRFSESCGGSFQLRFILVFGRPPAVWSNVHR